MALKVVGSSPITHPRKDDAETFIIRLRHFFSGYGGIGRRVGFRFQWETVQVQVLLAALIKKQTSFFEACFFVCRAGWIRTNECSSQSAVPYRLATALWLYRQL